MRHPRRGFQLGAGFFDLQRGHLFEWVPVAFGTGIGGYFALKTEPGFWVWILIVGVLLLCLALAWKTQVTGWPIFVAFALALAGLAMAGARTYIVADDKLTFRYYGPIQGRIVAIDRSQSDAVRLTLDQVILKDLHPSRTPAKVRVSLHGEQGFIAPSPGQIVILTGHLSPPSGPVEPGGFDFQRQAWFRGLGAVGYTRTPVLLWQTATGEGFGLRLYQLRKSISAAVQHAMPGRTGAFAAAIVTGDRSGMDRGTLDALRASNLAHLLAISGLHMGLLTGFVFAAVRLALALVPGIALRWRVKKIAAVFALVSGAGYLALSGGNVATERAYIMVAVMFLAALADRRAVTLRAVAIAAMIVLTLRPEALFGPGFQMSFAATTALVVVFGALQRFRGDTWKAPKWLRAVFAVVLSSAVAGAATAPFAAVHFNQIPHFGLLANVISVPLMGAVIIPAAVGAALLAPFGLAWVGLAIMKPAIAWILAVADRVASWEGALSFVHTPGPAVLPMMTIGLLFLVLWKGWGRVAGFAPVICAVVFWAQTERPHVLVSDSGGLIGVMTGKGRALSKPKGDGFSASSWLENDGDPASQDTAAAREIFDISQEGRVFKLGVARILHVTGRRAAERAVSDCANATLIVLNATVDLPKECNVIDPKSLRLTGALALYDTANGLRIDTARARSGDRLWNR